MKIARRREPRLDLTARFKEDRFAGTKEFSFQVDINILKYKFSSLGAPRQLSHFFLFQANSFRILISQSSFKT